MEGTLFSRPEPMHMSVCVCALVEDNTKTALARSMCWRAINIQIMTDNEYDRLDVARLMPITQLMKLFNGIMRVRQ